MGSEVDEEIQKSKKALMAISERDYIYFKGYEIDLDI